MIEREPAFKWVLRQELKKLGDNVDNPVLMDIGANIGDYTILMDEFLRGIPHQIVAIEPDPTTFETLELNMEFHGVSGVCSNYAVSDVCGESRFYSAAKNNLGSLIERSGFSKREIAVKCLTIPKVLEEHGLGHVDLIKMDIEGGEVLALRGAREFFGNGASPKILMEIHQLQYTKDLNLEDELRFLFDLGWTCLFMISTALPNFYSGYHECLPVHSFEVKPGWKRVVFFAPTNENVMRYACWENEIGIPTWHGTLSGKLVRALLLSRGD